jgi:hypothetical protein
VLDELAQDNRIKHLRTILVHAGALDAQQKASTRWRSATQPGAAVEKGSPAVSLPADKISLVQLKVTVGRTRGRFGLSAGYQSHSLELRHLNSHNISRGRRGTRTSHLSARGFAWVRGPTRDLSMRNGPTKTFHYRRSIGYEAG